MKEDEIKFFKTCYKYCPNQSGQKAKDYSFRDIINICGEFINYKRCWYLLQKWSGLDMYEYGVCLDLGWFTGQYPERYCNLIEEILDENTKIS